MKANELMIGDYVSHFNEGKNCVVTELRGKKVAVSYTDDNGNTKYSELLPEMAFKPIPLTAEILEKNGFEYYNDAAWVLANWFILVCEFDWLRYNDKIKIKYVHELQHVLRLCGIEKEIEL